MQNKDRRFIDPINMHDQNRICGERQRTMTERGYPMGDSKGRKEKAKGQKQHEARRAKDEKQKQNRQKPKTV